MWDTGFLKSGDFSEGVRPNMKSGEKEVLSTYAPIQKNGGGGGGRNLI